MAKVMRADTTPREASPKICVAMPPTMTAPRVLAMVLRVRIEEIVSSMWSRESSKMCPRRGWRRLRASTSAVVVLRNMASRREQKKETPSVKATARTRTVMGRGRTLKADRRPGNRLCLDRCCSQESQKAFFNKFPHGAPVFIPATVGRVRLGRGIRRQAQQCARLGPGRRSAARFFLNGSAMVIRPATRRGARWRCILPTSADGRCRRGRVTISYALPPLPGVG